MLALCTGWPTPATPITDCSSKHWSTGRANSVVSAFTAAEADHLVLTRLGVDAELALIDDLAVTYAVQSLDPAGMKRARDLCALYRDLELGLADASIVVLAEQWSTRSVATFDQRHFRAVVPLQGRAFHLLPADA